MTNNNRINPRVPIELPVSITLPDKSDIQVQSENVSLSGVMVTVNNDAFQAILHRKTSGHATQAATELKVSFTLARGNSTPLPIKTNCRAIHVRRIAQDKYLIGLKFLTLSQAAATAIQNYIKNTLD